MNQANNISRLSRFRPLPVLPQALSLMCDLLSAPSLDERQIVDVVSREPSLILQVLRISSPKPTMGAMISEHIRKSVRDLGRSGMKLVVSGALSNYLAHYLRPDFRAAYCVYWRRSLVTAITARQLAVHIPIEDAEMAYLCGLLLNVGKVPLILEGSSPNNTAASHSEMAGDTAGEPIEEGAVGEALLKGAFPLSIARDVVKYRGYPLEELKTALPLVKIVTVADMLATGQLAPENAPDEAFIEDFMGLSRLQIENILGSVADEITHVHELLQLPESSTPEVSDIGTAMPPALTRLLAKSMASQAENAVFSNSGTEAEKWVLLAQALAARYGIHSCLVMQYSNETYLLEPVYQALRTRDGHLSLRLPSDGSHAAAIAWRENRLTTVHARQSQPTATIADRQVMDVLGADGMVCIPYGDVTPAAGVVIAGIAGAKNDATAIRDEDIQNTVAAAFTAGITNSMAPLDASAHPLGGYAMERLLVKKTAHEIRTPLAIIKNYLSVLQLKLPQGHTAHAELTIIGEEIDRIGGLLSQMILPPPDETRDWLSVNDIIQQMVSVVQAPLPSPAMVKIGTDLDATLPTIYSSPDKIKQIVLNLIKNAVEALTDGGNINISTRCQSANAPDAPPETIQIIISDDGPGISDKIRASMFQPFNTTKNAGDTGLGLHIVRNAVNAIGGRIAFKSDAGQGTAFTIELPVTDKMPD